MHTTEVTASSSSCILHFFSSQATAFSFFHRKPPAASRRAACRREPTALLRPLTPAHANQACSAVAPSHRGTVLVDIELQPAMDAGKYRCGRRNISLEHRLSPPIKGAGELVVSTREAELELGTASAEVCIGTPEVLPPPCCAEPTTFLPPSSARCSALANASWPEPPSRRDAVVRPGNRAPCPATSPCRSNATTRTASPTNSRRTPPYNAAAAPTLVRLGIKAGTLPPSCRPPKSHSLSPTGATLRPHADELRSTVLDSLAAAAQHRLAVLLC